jgi:hypothetical protein
VCIGHISDDMGRCERKMDWRGRREEGGRGARKGRRSSRLLGGLRVSKKSNRLGSIGLLGERSGAYSGESGMEESARGR